MALCFINTFTAAGRKHFSLPRSQLVCYHTIILTAIAWQILNRSAWNFCTNIHNPEGLTSLTLATQQTSQSLSNAFWNLATTWREDVPLQPSLRCPCFPIDLQLYLPVQNWSTVSGVVFDSDQDFKHIKCWSVGFVWVEIRTPGASEELSLEPAGQQVAASAVRWPQVVSQLIMNH